VIIERYSVYDDVVIYFLKFKNKVTGEEWVHKQRYSEIRAINEALVNQGFKKLPPFPQRKFFGITNEDPGFYVLLTIQRASRNVGKNCKFTSTGCSSTKKSITTKSYSSSSRIPSETSKKINYLKKGRDYRCIIFL
jgi:hypothetical protein